jgi:hypothetical protein
MEVPNLATSSPDSGSGGLFIGILLVAIIGGVVLFFSDAIDIKKPEPIAQEPEFLEPEVLKTSVKPPPKDFSHSHLSGHMTDPKNQYPLASFNKDIMSKS